MRPEQTVQEGQQVGSQIKMLFLVLNIKEPEKTGFSLCNETPPPPCFLFELFWLSLAHMRANSTVLHTDASSCL